MSLPALPADGERPWGVKLRGYLTALADAVFPRAGTITRGAGSTTGSLTLTAEGRRRVLAATNIRAAGTSTLLATVDATDRPPSTVVADGFLTDANAANAWPARVNADGTIHLLATPPAGAILTGSLKWRTN